MELTHLSLFTGIGGIDLAAEWAGFETVGQVEWAEYPRKILEKHWPNVPRWKDAREFTAKSFQERTGLRTVTCISGGPPCQPHSVAGKHLADDDERDMWPVFRDRISEIRPKWVVVENVPGLLSNKDGRFFRGILRDFAALGFNVGWCTYSAASIGAIHRRNRLAIVAYANEKRLQGRVPQKEQQETNEQFKRAYLHLLRRADSQYLSESAILRRAHGVRNRVDRTKCLGNIAMPIQFYPIYKAIADIERSLS